MQIIPKINTVIESDLTPVGVANMLRCEDFSGSVGEEAFDLYLTPKRRDTLKPRLQGKIETIDGGCRVSVSLSPSNAFYILFALGVFFAALFLSNLCWLVFALSLDDLGSTLTNLVLSALLFVIPRICFKIHSKRSLEVLRSLIGKN